jgi:hypothetical protein
MATAKGHYTHAFASFVCSHFVAAAFFTRISGHHEAVPVHPEKSAPHANAMCACRLCFLIAKRQQLSPAAASPHVDYRLLFIYICFC